MTVDHDTLIGWLSRLKLTAIRDQLDNLLDEASRADPLIQIGGAGHALIRLGATRQH